MIRRAPLVVGFLLLTLAIPAALPLVQQGSQAIRTTVTPRAAVSDDAGPVVVPAGVGALGRVEPASRVRRVAPPSTVGVNRIHRLLAHEGDVVRAGQLLAELADADQRRAAVAEAEAAVDEARAELARIEAAARPEDVTALQQHIASLQYRQQLTRADALRAEALVPSGAGARAAAERAEAAANQANADLAEAQARLPTLTSPRPEDRAVARSKLAMAEARVVRAREDLALSQLVAPISGRILKIYAQPGDMIGPDGLLALASLDQMDVVADVYESDLPRVQVNARAEVNLPDSSVRYAATVQSIGSLVGRGMHASTDPTAAVDARTVEVRLRLLADGAAALQNHVNGQVHVKITP